MACQSQGCWLSLHSVPDCGRESESPELGSNEKNVSPGEDGSMLGWGVEPIEHVKNLKHTVVVSLQVLI